MLHPKEQLEQLKEGVEDFISEKELLQKIENSFKTKKPLIIKAGFDPSRADLHLGHLVLLNKLKQFQDLGHKIVFVVGDFTAQIGDPSGQNQTRPCLTLKEVKHNAKTYQKQALSVLKKKNIKIVFNNDWFKRFSSLDFIQLGSYYTVARMLERDDFKKRYKNEKPIFIHEFLYPLVQGYDSVHLKADVELGGTDQRFNLIVGRELQKSYNQPPQVVMTLPLLEGLDGVQKMSKSFNNSIGLTESPKDIFGKTMKLSDELMFRYYELLTPKTTQEIKQMKNQMEQGSVHPKVIKMELAHFFVSQFYSEKKANQAQEEFERIFSNKGLPDHIPEVILKPQIIWICQMLKDINIVSSTSEARRLIQSQAVSLDGEKVSDFQLKLDLKSHKVIIVKVGKKKFSKVKVQ